MLISADKTTCMSALSVFQLPDKWQKVTKHEVSNITETKTVDSCPAW